MGEFWNSEDFDREYQRTGKLVKRGLFAACVLNAFVWLIILALVAAVIWALLHYAGVV